MSYRICYGKEEKSPNYWWLLLTILAAIALMRGELPRQAAVGFYREMLLEAGNVP